MAVEILYYADVVNVCMQAYIVFVLILSYKPVIPLIHTNSPKAHNYS